MTAITHEPSLIQFKIYDAFINYFLFCFVALHPKSTAMVMVGLSVHLTTPFPGQA